MDSSSQMAGSSNPPDASARIQDLEYLYASIANFSNFVSVKLSSDRNYHLWKTQMLCLMKSHNMAGIVDNAYESPSASSKKIMDQYDSLLKGWIFGSVSENVLGVIVGLASAKEVWVKLKSFYDVTVSHQQDIIEVHEIWWPSSSGGPVQSHLLHSPKAGPAHIIRVFTLKGLTKSVGETEAEAKAEAETNTETKDIDEISAQTSTNGRDTVAIDIVSTKTESKKNLREATMKGDWTGADTILKEDNNLVREAINTDGSTILHIAVGIGNKDFVKNLFSYINKDDVVAKREDGSTALHIAAIVGNKYAAELLLKKNKECLRTRDGNGEEPLQKAYENVHLDTIGYLLKVIKDDRKSEDSVHPHLGDERGVDLLVNLISAKKYNLALKLIVQFPEFASKKDEVLMAIAKSFPSGDNVPLSWKDLWKVICNMAERFTSLKILWAFVSDAWRKTLSSKSNDRIANAIVTVLLIVEPNTYTKKIEKEDMDAAEKVLELVCDEIDKLKFTGTHHPYYTRPILEAACQNAHKVVDEILYRSPEAILSTDQSGYDIIQLAVIHRSERIYNLIYDIEERKHLYRTIEDSVKNNILHLVGTLAPVHVLKHTAGAALLQLQRDLQWREEVREVVVPTYITRENNFKETPDMVFTREHANLVKEGEQWLKTTAESCSISAGLITTIVFAAAITIPGGSNQDTGIPLFIHDIAFAIFAVSDAISFIASSTALLVFLSILTSRFAEQDFLIILPRRLFIGICTMLLSAISMMIAFSATLFIVFGHLKPWLVAPICGSSLIPISFFVVLPHPLIIDLYRSTYISKFGPQKRVFQVPPILDEAIGRLKTFEERVKAKKGRTFQDQDKLLFTKHNNNAQRHNQTRGRYIPPHSQNHDKEGNFSQDYNETTQKPRDFSKIKCYNCNEYGHYASHCHKRDRRYQRQEETNLIEEDLEPTLLLAVSSTTEDLRQDDCD